MYVAISHRYDLIIEKLSNQPKYRVLTYIVQYENIIVQLTSLGAVYTPAILTSSGYSNMDIARNVIATIQVINIRQYIISNTKKMWRGLPWFCYIFQEISILAGNNRVRPINICFLPAVYFITPFHLIAFAITFKIYC
jgi:hypothetical protein